MEQHVDSSPGQPDGATYRADGVTSAERYLNELARQSFLSLWSYPRVFRDQGLASGAPKEVCDLLVVFEEHILIFSDKHIRFAGSGDLRVRWNQWFRKAVLQSAEQLWGAERWIRSHPDRLFLDPVCTQRFPLDIPDLASAKVHRIVVAHGISEASRRELGGSGSLMVMPRLVGEEHMTCDPPFAVGHIDPTQGFVHVLDDISLDVLLTTLDTISDFTAYLEKKEAFIQSGRLIAAAGEEELLGYYLRDVNDRGEHDFIVPAGMDAIGLDQGIWRLFAESPERARQIAANEVSYAWDALIEKFNYHALTNTQYHATADLKDHERVVRLMAREPRTRRRMLARAILDLVARTRRSSRGVRCVLPSETGDPFYVLLVLPKPDHVSYEEYRGVRAGLLEACCKVVKLKYPHAMDVVGIATEAGDEAERSEDGIYFDARMWTPEDEHEARGLQEDYGLLTDIRMFAGMEKDYPDAGTPLGPALTDKPVPKMKGRDRNSPCPCGSGKKRKRCFGYQGAG